MTTLQRAATRQPGPGDLTGARALSATEAAKDRASIIENSAREIQDPDQPLVIISIPGRTSSFALPKFVYDAVRAAR